MFDSQIFLKVAKEFFYLFGELLILFVGISFLVALLQIYISPARIKNLLNTPKKGINSILGASLGAITPFCSCSTIPVLVGLIRSGAPFCGVISFLLTSPVLNPAIITLFIAFFGFKAMLIYSAFVFSVAVIVGLILDKLNFVSEVKENLKFGCGCGGATTWENLQGNFFEKQIQSFKLAAKNSRELFKDVFPYLMLGAGIGAFIHGVIPEEFLTNFAGVNNFFAIPIAAVIGIPMYIRTETMIPVAAILMSKGVAPGVVIALIIGGAGASLPELSLLNSIFKKKMIFAFVACVFFVAITAGCIFNFVL